MQVCVIPGDGIGPEVIGAATELLQAAAPDIALVEAEAGWETFQRRGTALPDETLAAAHAADAVLFGAVASPIQRVHNYSSPIVALRRALDLYANIRPVRLDWGRRISDSTGEITGRTSIAQSLVVVRENTEGLYAGRERLEDDGNTAIAERVITRRASERIVRRAFEIARSRRGDDPGHQAKVTIVHKANVLRVSDGLFREVALTIADQFTDVAVEEMLVDVAAMRLAQSPQRFDVVVTTNLFGDILSDVACIHGGGLGVAMSANFGEQHALFEPVHGAAPDIAGRGIANPLAAFGCVALLLDHVKHEATQRVYDAIAAVITNGPHTPDIGGNATTAEVTRALVEQVRG